MLRRLAASAVVVALTLTLAGAAAAKTFRLQVTGPPYVVTWLAAHGLAGTS